MIAIYADDMGETSGNSVRHDSRWNVWRQNSSTPRFLLYCSLVVVIVVVFGNVVVVDAILGEGVDGVVDEIAAEVAVIVDLVVVVVVVVVLVLALGLGKGKRFP